MGRVYKNGQRVRIIAKYGGKPTGTIVKWVKSLDVYNIKGDDGYNYNCVDVEEMEVLEEVPAAKKEELVIEVNASELPETPVYEKVTPDSTIEQLKLISALNQEITLSPAQAQKLVSEILELEKEKKRLEDGMKKIKMSVDFYSSEDVEEVK